MSEGAERPARVCALATTSPTGPAHAAARSMLRRCGTPVGFCKQRRGWSFGRRKKPVNRMERRSVVDRSRLGDLPCTVTFSRGERNVEAAITDTGHSTGPVACLGRWCCRGWRESTGRRECQCWNGRDHGERKSPRRNKHPHQGSRNDGFGRDHPRSRFPSPRLVRRSKNRVALQGGQRELQAPGTTLAGLR